MTYMAGGIQSRGSHISLTSPMLGKLSKNCAIVINYYNYYFGATEMRMNVSSSNKNSTIINWKATKYTAGSETVNLSYHPNNTQIVIDNPSSLPKELFIYSIQFIKCNSAHIPFDCNFTKNKNCDYWFEVKRYAGIWSWNSAGYIYNDKPYLAEIRSPLITQITEKGSTLSFDYMITSKENALHVTKIDLKDNSEEIIWSTTEPTVNNKWQKKTITLQYDTDIDIGFISQASAGIVAIDNVTLSD